MESNLLSTETLDNMFLSGDVITNLDEKRLQGILDGKAELSDVSVKETFGSWKFQGVPNDFNVTGIEYFDGMWLLYTDSTEPLSSNSGEYESVIEFEYEIVPPSSEIDVDVEYGILSAIKSETPSYTIGGNENRPVQGKLPDDFLSSVQFLTQFKDQFRTTVEKTLNSEITFKEFLEELSGILS